MSALILLLFGQTAPKRACVLTSSLLPRSSETFPEQEEQARLSQKGFDLERGARGQQAPGRRSGRRVESGGIFGRGR